MKLNRIVLAALVCGYGLFVSKNLYAPPPVPQTIELSSATYSVNENGVSATVTVTRSSQDVNRVANVDFETSDGSAAAGSDYTAVSLLAANGTSVHFDSGETSKDVVINITDDAVFEGDETVTMTLSNVGGPGASLGAQTTAVLTIVDDELGPTCGNGVIEAGEQCDDGNTNDGDGCNASCQNEFCGDGSVNNNGAEQCDDGNADNGDCCDSNCQFEPNGSSCDDNNSCTATDTCDGSGLCTGSGSTCGNGNLDGSCGELCDDTNLDNGDGCSNACQTEFCGDGSVNNGGTETCDDGNLNDGDGCAANCVVETPAPDETPVEEPSPDEAPVEEPTPDETPADPAVGEAIEAGGGGCSLIR